MLQKKIEDLYSEFIAKRTYTRWLEEEKRRETWEEAVSRYGSHFSKYVPTALEEKYHEALQMKTNKEVMGSMRALWSAGPALEENSFAAYNCAFIAFDCKEAFAETLYTMMHGTGVGFSVERQFVSLLPVIPDTEFTTSAEVFKVADSKLGWKQAFDHCIDSLYSGVVPSFDYSEVRPKGTRLKTFGGRASGPEPLKQLFSFTIRIFTGAKGRKLNSLEVHDIATKTGECVVVGGVRRSACVSFSNLSDQRMKHAKNGNFWVDNSQRAMANNSVAYTEKPDSAIFMEEWLNLLRSGSGERGIFNAEAARAKADKFGRMAGEVRSNPCVEALLMSRQLCNLTEVIIRPEDTIESLKQKIESAVLFGCLQAMETNFGDNVSIKWKEYAEAERLIGVSLTGIADSPLFRKVSEKSSKALRELKDHAHAYTKYVASEMGIVAPKQVTVVKPSGTISQLCNTSSGMHTRYSDYYIRRVRVNAKDPIALLLMSKEVPCSPEVGQSWDDYNTLVFEFPMKSPRGSLKRDDQTALEQLEYWKMINDNWCDGNPSCTVYVKPEEWVEVGAWVYKNWDSVCGLSFLPFDGGNYPLAPYEEISKSTYHELCSLYSKIDIDFDSELDQFEKNDNTSGAQELACSGGSCELR